MSAKTVWEFIKKYHPIVIISFISLIITIGIVHETKERNIVVTPITPVDTMMYHTLIKELNGKIIVLDDSINSLNNRKAKIKIKYETQYTDYLNPVLVSDDSITGYISNRIQQKRHDIQLLQQGRK